ncbi:retrovirus-related pol polyprotein from transposon TNT 1-94 [Tanacetum coccineum]
MVEEMESLKENHTYELVELPKVKMSSIRVVLGLAASMDLEVQQMDVKTTFLHGDLEEEIYMDQLERFKVKGKESMVCKLKKSLYGLKQAPRQCFQIKTLLLLLYVDDMLLVGSDIRKIDKLKKELNKSFSMKDLGKAKQILRMRILRDRKAKKLWLSQEMYIEKVLERFRMHKAKSVGTSLAENFKLSKKQCPSSVEENLKMKRVPYASAVGSLMYAMVCTRPNLAYVVGVVSRYLLNPSRAHWEAVKWILRYLRDTSKMCICYGYDKLVLKGFTYYDMARDIDTRKYVSGYLVTFGGGAVSW